MCITPIYAPQYLPPQKTTRLHIIPLPPRQCRPASLKHATAPIMPHLALLPLVQVKFAIKLMANDSEDACGVYEAEVANLKAARLSRGVMLMYGKLPALPPIAGMPPTHGCAGILMPLASHGSLAGLMDSYLKNHPRSSGLPLEIIEYILSKAILVRNACMAALFTALQHAAAWRACRALALASCLALPTCHL